MVWGMSSAIGEDQASAALPQVQWLDTFERLSAARDAGLVEADDLERLAVAAYMLGRDSVCEKAWIAAHQEWLRRGERERAASCAFRHALGLFFRGDLAPAIGWVGRGGRLLEQSRSDSIEHAWLRMLTDLPRLFRGDPGAGSTFVEAEERSERLGNVDAVTFARIGRGYSLILERHVARGMALLDEVMVSVAAGEVAPVLSGIAYCQVITLCHDVFDLRRAHEWTEALTRWCDAQPGIVPFRGHCLVHRCELLQLRGAWTDAVEHAEQACSWLAGPPIWDALGSAYYQLAEIQRLRGDLAAAEESYLQASLAGRDPEPGMSLLRLGQGRIDLALPAVRRALAEATGPTARSRLLPACVEIMLEARETGPARTAADELARLAAEFDTPFLEGLVADAYGAVLVAEGDPSGCASPPTCRASRVARPRCSASNGTSPHPHRSCLSCARR